MTYNKFRQKWIKISAVILPNLFAISMIIMLPVFLLVVACKGEARAPQNPNMPENRGQYTVLADHPNYIAISIMRDYWRIIDPMIRSYTDDGWSVSIRSENSSGRVYIVEFRRCSVEVKQ